MHDIEVEIKDAVKRIQFKQKEIDDDMNSLKLQILKFTKLSWLFVWIGACISIIAIVNYLITNIEPGFGLNLLGDFMAGTVASVWSLAGLFFIYVAFLGQKQQLLNQQLEIMFSQLDVKYTRLELAGQKTEMKEQNRTLKRQRFENTFFQLTKNLQNIVNSIDVKKFIDGDLSHIIKGKDCFKLFHEDILEKTCNLKNKNLENTCLHYTKFFKENQSDLCHYFSHLYQILKFVKNSKELTPNDKFNYTNLVRALLSPYELVLIFYNGVSIYGIEKFKPLLEEFSILKNMDFDLLIKIDHKNEYSELAFASSERRKQILK